MKEQFIFKGEKPEDSSEIVESLHEIQKEGEKPIKGEIEKSESENRFIVKCNSYLNGELADLGVEEKSDITPEAVHFLPSKVFKKLNPENLSASVSLGENSIQIDKQEMRGRLDLYKTVTHEMVHTAAFRKKQIQTEGGIIKVDTLRGGYLTRNPESPDHEHFRGLGEAIVEKTTMDILKKHAGEIVADFNISPEEQKQPVDWQYDNMEVLNAIIRKIAESSGEEESIEWEKFKKGQFTGEMMHLRDIEKVFGKGSLRVLAAMGPDSGDGSNKRILSYFETDDKKERSKIATKIIGKTKK
jgi:hypothetical protein